MPYPVRLDEFSQPSEIDGSFTDEEQSRFLSFGFDFVADEPVERTPGAKNEQRLIEFILLEDSSWQ